MSPFVYVMPIRGCGRFLFLF